MIQQQAEQHQQQQQGDAFGVVLTVGDPHKGHVVEDIYGNVLLLYRSYRWKPIPRCTGRYTCRDHALVSHKTPTELVEGIITRCGNNTMTASCSELEFVLKGRSDVIKVLPLDNRNVTGIITYVKDHDDDSSTAIQRSYVHTLNTPSGFRRKLEAIGIQVTDDEIKVA